MKKADRQLPLLATVTRSDTCSQSHRVGGLGAGYSGDRISEETENHENEHAAGWVYPCIPQPTHKSTCTYMLTDLDIMHACMHKHA